MNRGYLPWLLLLSALWGSSYFVIKVAVDDLEPSVMMCVRALVAGLLLLAFLFVTKGVAWSTTELRAAGRATLVFGCFNAALPFWLIAWGEKHIDSTVAGIAQATVPIFAFVIGLRYLPHEHVPPIRWVGVGLGLVGVAVLTGIDLPGGWWAVAGTLAVVLSSVSYAVVGDVRAAACPRHARAGARGRGDARRRTVAAADRARASCRTRHPAGRPLPRSRR